MRYEDELLKYFFFFQLDTMCPVLTQRHSRRFLTRETVIYDKWPLPNG